MNTLTWVINAAAGAVNAVPSEMNAMLNSPDRDGARRAMNAMLQMGKIDVEQLRAAFEDRTAVGTR